MRTRINNITFTPGTRSINTGIIDLTVDDVRLFINESQMKVICSSMLKSNIDSIVSGVVTYKNIFPVLAAGDHITFEIDRGDNVAKENTVTSSKLEILNKIDNIPQPDLSTVAKQGSNPNTSLTIVDNKIDDFYDTFDADIALQLQGIIGDTEESVGGTSQTATQVEELRTLQLSYDELAGNMQSLANSWEAMVTNRNSLAGVTFVEDVNGIVDVLNILARLGYQSSITEINDNTSTILPFKLLNGNTTLRRATFQSVTSISGTNEAFQNTYGILYINLPSVTRIETYRNFKNATVREVHIPNCSYIYTYEQLSNAVDLILLEIGGGMTGSFNISTWSPTNALSSSSSSLVEQGETFANNLEKLLYNIREHIAANLPDRTGLSALTITFSAAVKAAILADTDTANAFADKNWTVS